MVTEKNKDDLLAVLYELGGSQINKNVYLGEAKIHFDHWDDDTFWETAKALEADKLIVHRMRGWVGLTSDGRHRANNSLHPAPSFTQNIINVGKLINSPVQQGGAHATMTQIVSYNAQDLDDLRRLVEAFENHVDDLALDTPAKRKAMAQIATIKSQLQDEPDPAIVKKAGGTLRSITEKVIAGLIVAGATNPAVWTQAHAIMSKLFGGP